jgi:hypothetical protein
LMVPKRRAMEIFEYRTFTGHWGIDLGFTQSKSSRFQRAVSF